MRGMGAEVITIAPATYPDPKNYRMVAAEAAKEEGAYFINQFDNTSNYDAHYRTTGPEIWEQTDHAITGFSCAIGSGGTLAGISKFLKEKNPKIRISCVDPVGSSMFSYFTTGEAKPTPGESIVEGISQGVATANVKPCQVDESYVITDDLLVNMIHYIVKEEGLFLGSSSAVNLCGAYLMAKKLGKGNKVVTILCDSGQKYISKLYNPEFIKEKGLQPSSKPEDLFPKLDALLK
jgi:cysteine synthase A